MKLRRFKIHREAIQGREAVIEERGEIRHISKVLRMGVGDSVILFDGEGNEYAASIARASSDRICFSLLPVQGFRDRESSSKIILGPALLKSAKFDWLLQKATELGVSEIVPFSSSFVVPRWEEGKTRSRQARWGKIVTAAAKQCGRIKIPIVHPVCSFKETLEREFSDVAKIFLWERERTKNLTDALGKKTSGVFVLVGPEGGFSEVEALQAREAGFQPVCLGPRILRAETAGIVIVSLIQFVLGDLSR
jgi:16S rRNA (uracil1498-N3)-methyltransferase